MVFQMDKDSKTDDGLKRYDNTKSRAYNQNIKVLKKWPIQG